MKLVNFVGLLGCVLLTACFGFGKKDCAEQATQTEQTEQTTDAAAADTTAEPK